MLICLCGKSQQYPISVSLQTDPPFQLTWSGFSNPFQNNFRLILLQNDLGAQGAAVQLRFELSGPGFTIRSRENTSYPAIQLLPGVPQFIDGGLLSNYFGYSKWATISGNTPSNNGNFPLGGYSLKAWVIQDGHPQQLQLSAIEQNWFFLQAIEAPQPLFPSCNSQIQDVPGSTLSFQWSVPFISDPDISNRLLYSFQLFEIRGINQDPNFISNSTAPIYSTTVQNPFFEYGISEPPLIPGWKYAWRVNVFDPLNELTFANQGYSFACEFRYGENLQSPLVLSASQIMPRTALLSWNVFQGATDFTLQIKKTGTAQWYSANSAGIQYRYQNLEPGTNYEARVKAITPLEESEWSNIVNFTTPELPQISCGQNDPFFTPTTFNPIAHLVPGNIVRVGQFEMQIIEAYSTFPDGFFRGRGKINIYGTLPLSVKFERIFVDENLILRNGIVEAETQGLGTWYNNNTVGTISDGNESAEHIIDEDIENIIIGPNNEIIINGSSSSIFLDTIAGTTLEDSNGTLFIVTENGNVINAGQSGNRTGICPENENLIFPELVQTNLLLHSDEKYGTDVFRYSQLQEYYLNVRVNNRHYPNKVDWKSVRSSKYDVIEFQLTITENSINPDSIRFETWTGTRYNFARENNNYTLHVIGGNHGDGQELFIYAKHENAWKKIGKLNIVHYNQIEKKLIVLKSPTAILDNESLISSFKGAIASWNIEIKNWQIPVGWDLNNDGKIEAGGIKTSDELLVVIEAIKSESWYDNEAYYLILTAVESSETDLKGEMRRGKKFGFIFPQTEFEINRTAAHELGHGAFGWEHTFSGNTPISKGTSDNIMDYGLGNKTFKFQWDLAQDPALLPGLDDDEEDIQLRPHSALGEYVNVIGKNYVFPAPSGVIFALPNVTHVKFNHSGAVTRFILNDGKEYIGFCTSNDQFIGYYDTSFIRHLEGVFTNEKKIILATYEFKDYSIANNGDLVLSRSAKSTSGIVTDCYCYKKWSNVSSILTMKGDMVRIQIPENAITFSCTGTECLNPESEGVEEGLGMQLYYFLRPKLPSDTEPYQLTELCNFLSETGSGKIVAFYGNTLERYHPSTRISPEVAALFIQENIFTLTRFQQLFPFRSFARDVDVIYANTDLRNGIPESYNTNSIDYDARRNNIQRPYSYSYSDLCSRKKLIGTYYTNLILTYEQGGNACPLSESDFYIQYVGLYGDDSAFPFIARNFCAQVKDVLIALTGLRFAPQFFEVLVTNFTEQFLTNLAIGAAIDVLIQIGAEYFFAEEDISLSEALGRINYSQALKEGVLDGVCGKLNGILPQIMGALGDCISAGSSGNIFTEDFDYASCSSATWNYFLGTAATVGILKTHRIFKRINLLPLDRIERGLRRMGIVAQEKIDNVLAWMGKRVNRLIVRGVSKNAFLNSVAEFAQPQFAEISEQAWEHFSTENWTALESLFNTHNINGKWPPYGGFISSQKTTLRVGETFDRYGGGYENGKFVDRGTYSSPLSTPFDKRALPIEYLNGPGQKPYKKYRIKKDIGDVSVGDAIPWFNMPGKGTQYNLPFNIQILVEEGYIEEIL